jgi:hypothetical protein
MTKQKIVQIIERPFGLMVLTDAGIIYEYVPELKAWVLKVYPPLPEL